MTVYTASIFVSVYGNRLNHNLLEYVPSVAEAAGLPKSSITALLTALASGATAAIAKVPGMNATIQKDVVAATRHAYEASFRTVFLTSLAFGGLAIISAWFTPNTARHMTNFINTKVDGTQSKVANEKVIDMDEDHKRVHSI
jgi:hypothetical protein